MTMFDAQFGLCCNGYRTSEWFFGRWLMIALVCETQHLIIPFHISFGVRNTTLNYSIPHFLWRGEQHSIIPFPISFGVRNTTLNYPIPHFLWRAEHTPLFHSPFSLAWGTTLNYPIPHFLWRAEYNTQLFHSPFFAFHYPIMSQQVPIPGWFDTHFLLYFFIGILFCVTRKLLNFQV